MPEHSPQLSLIEQVDAECDRYEAAFRARQNPRMEVFLETVAPSVRTALFRALLELDIELRKGQGERPVVSDYEERFPEEGSRIQAIFEEAQRAASLVSSVKLTGVETSQGPKVKTTPTMTSAVPPKQLGRFEIRSVLGEGAFGTVYRARDPQLDRDVALKVPRFAGKQSREERERFLREARAAAGLHQAHICPVHEVGTIDGRDYIVLAYIDGKPLSKLLQTQPKLSGRQIAAVVRKLALALQEAHDQGIIHRDLKPANIMINRKGEPVIMDFGLARRENSGDAQISHSGQIMGTPAYMSPEQARGDGKAVGPGSDIYSLGVVLYELLCGRRPFEGTVTEVIGQILHVEPPQPSQFRSDVDPRLQAICMRAIAKTPSERYSSMKEFATALADYARTTPSEQRPSAPPVETRKEIATNQFADLLAAISSDVESKVERAVSKAGHVQRIPWWTYLVGSGLMGLIVLLGIFFFIKKDTVTVIVNIPMENINDPSLSFLLDNNPIAATAFASPIELKPGKHELIVNQDGKLFKRFVFDVGEKQSDPVVVQDVTPEPPTEVQVLDDGWVSLFNGKDLTGWKTHPSLPVGWSVENGFLTGRTNGWAHLFSERGDYKDFHLRAECRTIRYGNGGIFFRSPFTLDRGNGKYPSGYEAQILHEYPRASASLTGSLLLASDGRQPLHKEERQLVHLDDWFTIEVIARGKQLTVMINGEVVSQATDDTFQQGHISLQCLKDPETIGIVDRSTVQFRKIKIKELTTPDDGWINLFNDKDLTGWNNPNQASVTQGWSVKDGSIVRDKSNPNDAPGGVWQRGNLWTQRRFEDFVLELEFRGTGTNTLVIRADQPNNDYSDRGLHIPLNLRGTPGNYWWLGTFYPFKSPKSEPRIKDDWNQLRLTAVGPEITVDLNGETINSIDLDRWVSEQTGKIDPDLPKILQNLSRSGHIGFNAREGEISLRNIRIKELGKDGDAKVNDPDQKAAVSQISPVQLQLIEKIEQMGGTLTRDESRASRPVIGVSFYPAKLKPNDVFLSELRHFPDLQSLNLWGSDQVTNEGLRHLGSLKLLRSLDLGLVPISDVGVAYLARLKQLTNLNLSYTRVTDAGLSTVARFQSLQSLSLDNVPITDEGLKPLGALTDLRYLNLLSTKIEGPGFKHLTGLLNLSQLWLSASPVSDEGVQYIASLPAVSQLYLAKTKITDASLDQLTKLKSLKELTLQETAVTHAGIDQLRLALPDCRITKE